MTTTKAAPTPYRVALLEGETEYQVVSNDTLDCIVSGLTEWRADLFADALNVHHETGLSPRELANRLAKAEQQRDQAVAALGNIEAAIDGGNGPLARDHDCDWDRGIVVLCRSFTASAEGGAK